MKRDREEKVDETPEAWKEPCVKKTAEPMEPITEPLSKMTQMEAKMAQMAAKMWSDIPEPFCTLFPTQPPSGLITPEMKARDACGLLSQRHSIHFDEVSNPVTFLVDSRNWALVFRLHAELMPRPQPYVNLLDYVWTHKKTWYDLNPECCVACRICTQLNKGEKVADSLWQDWGQTEHNKVSACGPASPKAKPDQKSDFLLWFFSYRGNRQYFLAQDDAPQLKTPWFLDSNGLAPHCRLSPTYEKRAQMLVDLVQQKSCTIECDWEETKASQMILTLV